MAEDFITINAAVAILGDVIQAALWPVTVQVTNFVHTNRDTVLIWQIAEDNGKFDLENPFQWNTSGTTPEPPAVQRVDDWTLQSEPYKNTATGEAVKWVYTIHINKAGQRIGIDPEVDNLPPGGP
jgi:hypothetical protein